MKRFLISLLPFGFGFAHAKDTVDLGRLADSIAAVENAKTTHIGKAGERSRYQITRAVWTSQTSTSFLAHASSELQADLDLQRSVAYGHLLWLYGNLEHPTVYRLAAAWNGGFHAAQTGNFSRATADYAKRVRNLYNEEKHEN